MLHVICLVLLPGADPPATKPMPPSPEEVRKVVTAIVRAAEENAARPRDKLRGDALTDLYVRRAAAAAPSTAAFLVGLGVALDSTDLLRKNPLVGPYLARVESTAERRRRLRCLGQPALRGRHDWAMHFAVSAALTAHQGPNVAEATGLSKELMDAQPGGSGFSFGDLAADYAGVAFARKLLGAPERGQRVLRELAERFQGSDYLPPIEDLEEGLSAARLAAKYGGADDPRLERACDAVRRRVLKAPGLQGPK
jgi:hypothetical protein